MSRAYKSRCHGMLLQAAQGQQNSSCLMGQALFSPANASAFLTEPVEAVFGTAVGSCQPSSGLGCSLQPGIDYAGKVGGLFFVVWQLSVAQHSFCKAVVLPDQALVLAAAWRQQDTQ